MSTSDTFEFQSPQSEQIIRDAYERVGVIGPQASAELILSAQRLINFILTSWVNRGLNLWTVKKDMMTLLTNQATYDLPEATSDVLEATLRTSTRNLSGTAFSSSGVAANAFDNDSNTACTQNAPNGNIGYTWGDTQYAIAMVGVQSNSSQEYTLAFEYSNDNVTWVQVGSAPLQEYIRGVISWFVITAPVLGSYFRVRETGGATLNIQELYFNTALNDMVLTRISRSEYISLPQKGQSARPSSFWVDRQINPTITLWPVPTAQYNNLFYTRVEMPQDIGALTNSPYIPSRFLEALTAELAYKLAIKQFKDFPQIINLIPILKQDAVEQYKLAGQEDAERVPLRIYADYAQGYMAI